jgi:hypothetical protein
MNILNEKRTLTTIRLTDNQKKVMTRIVASATEVLAAEEISKGRQLVTARDLLVKLGLIEFRDGYAALTPEGEKIMKDTNLTDDMGELTDDGNKFAYEEGKEPMATESLIKTLNTQINEAAGIQFSDGEKKEIVAIEQGKKELDMDSPLYDKLFNYFSNTGDMPYGVQKARTGDPDQWIIDHLDQITHKF